ncbi:MAG: hypothetical protein AB7F43_04230 [Bacteriovoracia bacterium]
MGAKKDTTIRAAKRFSVTIRIVREVTRVASRAVVALSICFGGVVLLITLWLPSPVKSSYRYRKAYDFSLQEAKKKWPPLPFDVNRYRKSDKEIQARILVGLIESGDYLGKPLTEITSWFHRDRGRKGVSYIVGNMWTDKAFILLGGFNYEISFWPNKDNHTVGKVEIEKVCCESPYVQFLHFFGLYAKTDQPWHK